MARKKSTPAPPTAASPPLAAPNCVTIFGGGVAGLSAAHELVERGFRVQVWEPTQDERDPSRGCDVGGLARTQWASVPWEQEQELFKRPKIGPPHAKDPKFRATRTGPINHLAWVLYLGAPKEYKLLAAASETQFVTADNGNAALRTLVKDAAAAMLRAAPDPQDDEYVVYCEVQHRTPVEGEGFDEAARVIDEFGKMVKEVATLELVKGNPPVYANQQEAKLVGVGRFEKKSVRFFISLLDGFPDWISERVHVRVTYRIRERWIPGEHGFRVFPSFYHHLFDTMRRTPILEPAPKSTVGAAQERSVTVNANEEKYVETGRTVFDNLRETTKQVIAAGHGTEPAVLPRSMPTSFEGVRDWLRLFLEPHDHSGGGFGFTLRDLARFRVKIFQYLTSCGARRDEYENMTWVEFLGGADKFSPACAEVLKKWPRALVAMDADSCDARTMGSPFVQLLLDDLRPSGYRDGTLTGPTSLAWLSPWRRYLEAQGVEFIHGKLKGFKAMQPPGSKGAARVLWPDVECYEPRYPGAIEGTPALMPGYFLLALPDLEAKRIALSIQTAAKKAGLELARGGDIERTVSFFAGDSEADLRRAKPEGQLRHMVGIQYYFDADINWRDGHYYMPLTAWGLTAISQVRFWQDRHDWEHGYRGILSVVFTNLDGPTEGGKKSAWMSSPDEIAAEIWSQVRDALVTDDIPEPRYWHLDYNFVQQKTPKKTHAGYENRNPLLVNLPGKWEQRPGKLANPARGRLKKIKEISGYDVDHGIVLAGTFMKTYTRLTTMEAANESARHAVNAIIQHSHASDEDQTSRLTPCDIWPLEEREVDDLAFFKELDKELYERGLEHFVGILDLDEIAGSALRGSSSDRRDPFDPLSILAKLGRLIRNDGERIADVLRNSHR